MLVGLAVVGGCQRHGVLDPDAPPGKLDSGVIGPGGPPTGGGGAATGSGGGAPAPDGGQTDARGDVAGPIDAGGAPDARPAPDAGGPEGGPVVTAAPTSACALGSGNLPAAPPNATTIRSCSSWYPVSGVMKVGPAPAGQAYRRCGTLGPETGWRVTLSPDGGHLAAQTSAGTVRLYRTDLWVEIAQIASPVGSIDAIAFSPDGFWLAGLSREMGRLTIWNVLDGVPAETYDAPPGATLGSPSSALAFSSDGRRVATSLGMLVDRQTGKTTSLGNVFPGSTSSLRFVGCDQRILAEGANASGMVGWVESVSLIDPVAGTTTGIAGGLYADIGDVVASSDSRWVALVQAGDNSPGLHGLRLYDAAAATQVAFDANAPRFVAGFSRAGDRLFVVNDTTIEVRNVPTLNVIRRIALTSGAVPTAATVSPRDQVILSTDSETNWVDPNTGNMVRNQRFPIAGAQFSADGRFGVSAGDGAALFHLWSEADTTTSCSPPASPPDAAIAGFAVSQDARTLAMVDAAGVVQLSAVDAIGAVYPPWTRVETGVAPWLQNIAIAVANGGTRVAVQGHVPTTSDWAQLSRLVVADTTQGTLRIVRDVPRLTGALAISPDSAWVGFQDGDYTGPSRSVVLSVATGATMLSLPSGLIDSFSPDSKQLAVAASGAFQAWDVATGAAAMAYSVPDSTFARAALSPDWSLMGGIVSPNPYSADKLAATVWHAQDGSIVRQIGRDGSFYIAPRFDTANTIVASFSYEAHTLGTDWFARRVWSVTDGTQLRAFPLSSAITEPFAILPGGQRLLTRAGTAVAVWCR